MFETVSRKIIRVLEGAGEIMTTVRSHYVLNDLLTQSERMGSSFKPTITDFDRNIETLFSMFVSGKAKPKGSLKLVSRRGARRPVMREMVVGSLEWKQNMISEFQGKKLDGRLFDDTDTFPIDDAVALYATFWVERPKTNRDLYPSKASSGDLDKLMRNLGDALEQSGILRNDARIVDVNICKRWATTEQPAGVLVTLFPVL